MRAKRRNGHNKRKIIGRKNLGKELGKLQRLHLINKRKARGKSQLVSKKRTKMQNELK